MNKDHPILNIVKVVLFLIVAGVVLSGVLGLISGLLWLVIKILVPVAIVVWLFRVLTKPKSRRNY